MPTIIGQITHACSSLQKRFKVYQLLDVHGRTLGFAMQLKQDVWLCSSDGRSYRAEAVAALCFAGYKEKPLLFSGKHSCCILHAKLDRKVTKPKKI